MAKFSINENDPNFRSRSGQTQIGKCHQVMIGRALGKAAEHDMGNAAVGGAKLRGNGADRDARCPVGRESINAGRYRRKSNGSEAVRCCKIESGAIAGCKQLLLSSISPSPHRADGVDDVARRQAIAAGDFCRTGFTAAKGSALGQQDRSGSAVNSAVDPTAAKERPVGSVDDSVGGERCDVGDADVEPRRTDRGTGKRRDIGDRSRHEA
jgi:hypothetical protein